MPALVRLLHDERIGIDTLFTYQLGPATALYLGYTSGFQNVSPLEEGRPVMRIDCPSTQVGRQVLLKISYWCEGRRVGTRPQFFPFLVSCKNCASLMIVMRCPFARSRLISISFRPASRPAAQRVGLAAHHHLRLDRRHAVHHRARALGGLCGFAAQHAEDTGEGQVHALQGAQRAEPQ